MSRFTILTDHELTRRKRFHFVYDTDGDVVFSGRWWIDVMQFIQSEGEESFDIPSPNDKQWHTWTLTNRREKVD